MCDLSLPEQAHVHTPHTSLAITFFLVQKIKDSGWHDIFKGIINFLGGIFLIAVSLW